MEPLNEQLAEVQARLREFARERDWGQFHSPKNLATALSVEASELLEHFQWLTEEQSSALNKQQRAGVEEEIADVFLYTLLLADKLNIDLAAAAKSKMALNAQRYPADKVRGSAKKHTEYV